MATGIGHNLDRLARYAQSTETREQAVELARAEVRAAVAAAAERCRGIGVIHAVSGLRVHMAMLNSIGAGELAAALLELLALALAGQGGTGRPHDEGELAYDPDYVRAQLSEALDAGSMITMLSLEPTDQNSPIVLQTVLREIALRNGTYPHMLLDTLWKIFSDSDVNNDCQQVLGFTGADAVAVMEAARMQAIGNLHSRMDRMMQVRDSTMPLIKQWHDGELADEDAQVAVAEQIRDALEGLTTRIDTATVIDVDALAGETGISTATIDSVLDAYTVEPIDIDVALDRFFTGDNPLRTAPIITDAAGRRMLVHDALALPAICEVIETRLKAANRADAYFKWRGDVAEDDAIDLLAGVFPGAEIHRGFEYFIPNPASATAETAPEMYTKRVEGDGLILVDDVALIVEVKAAALKAKSRRGFVPGLRDQIHDIITDAAAQADRLRERIQTDGRIRLNKDKWIDVSNVREVHTLAVSLEDLAGVTTATAALVQAGLLPPDAIPWTVSIHDLRIICEILDRPSELLFYLRRRTDPDATRKFLAVDELDLYLHALAHGLYVVPDPEKRAAALPFPGRASVAEKRRFANQRMEIIESRTEPLDAWYAAQTNPGGAPPEPKPRLNVDAGLLALVDALADTGSPGWLATSATLLEQGAPTQQQLGRMPRDLAKQGRLDRQAHTYATMLTDTSGTVQLVVLATGSPDDSTPTFSFDPELYLAAKKHQLGAVRATMIVFDSTGTTIDKVLFNNAINGPNAKLDAVAATLRPLDRTSGTVPRPGRGKRAARGSRRR